MSKKKTRCKHATAITGSCLSNMLNDVAEVLENKDWTVLGGANTLADEELDALSTGAMAAIATLRAMLGAFGGEIGRRARMAGPTELATGIMTTAVTVHREAVEDADRQAAKPGVRITIEHKG